MRRKPAEAPCGGQCNSPPVLIVDLVGSGPLGVGPVTPALAHDLLVGAIEMFVIEQEGVVLQQELEGRGCETAWREE